LRSRPAGAARLTFSPHVGDFVKRSRHWRNPAQRRILA
jgi:hypothetical protein